MKVTLYQPNYGTIPQAADLSWQQLWDTYLGVFEYLHSSQKEKGASWSPVELSPNTTRKSINVLAVTCAAFDLDNFSKEKLDACVKALNARGLAYGIHSTNSHNPPNAFRLRIVFPFLVPFEKSRQEEPEYRRSWISLREAIIKDLELEGTDPTCKDLSRIYYLPSFNESLLEDQEISIFKNGRFLDWREIETVNAAPLSVSSTDPLKAIELAKPQELETTSDTVDVEEARKILSNTRNPESSLLIHRVLKGEPLGADGKRELNLFSVVRSIHNRCPKLPKFAVLELLRPSLSAQVIAGSRRSLDEWVDEAAKKFDARVAERQDWLDKKEGDRAAKTEQQGKSDASFSDYLERQKLDLSTVMPEDVWRSQLVTSQDKNGLTHNKSTFSNADIILRQSATWHRVFRVDRMKQVINCFGGPFAQKITMDKLVTDTKIWLERNEEIKLDADSVWRLIVSIAEDNAYNSLHDHLNDQPAWCGVPLDWVHTIFNVKKVDDTGKDISEYNRLIGRRLGIGLMARAFEPGCQMENMLTIEGEQGDYKSTALRVLAGDFFCNSRFVIGNVDGLMLINTAWIYEVPEWDVMMRSDARAQKAFLSQSSDKYRVPYGRVPEDHPRPTVVIGTLNPDPGGYLTDNTGNRRFWSLSAGHIDIPALKAARPQLLAEWLFYYRAGFTCASCLTSETRCAEHRWWFTKDEQPLAEEQANKRVQQDGIAQEILISWQNMKIGARPPSCTNAKMGELAGLNKEKLAMDRGLQTRVGNAAIKQLGFISKHTNLGTIYVASERLLNMPQISKHTNTLQDIEDAEAKTYEN